MSTEPASQQRVDLRRWAVPVGVPALFVVLLLLVWIGSAAAVTGVDTSIERWAVEHRTSGWTAFFRGATNFGNPGIAFTVGLVLAAIAVVRSRRTGLLLLLLALARPLASTVVKHAVDRPRPQRSQLVSAGGAPFPSGHVLAATALWGAVPITMLAWSAARAFVRSAVVVAVLAVAVTAASRVYLGVHWPTDVLGGALLGAVLLVPVCRYRISTMDP
ncbi:MAG: phosphatase PAP2 family protein [Jatrophihabitantaceae bacterium]